MEIKAISRIRLFGVYSIIGLISLAFAVGAASADNVTISVSVATDGGGSGGNVTANYPIAGGVITVPKGSTVMVTAEANFNDGYYIREFKYDSEVNRITEFPIVTSWVEFENVQSNHSVSVTFGRWYLIESVVFSGGGSITPYTGSEMVPEGVSWSFNFIPDPDYMILDVQVNGVSQGVISQYSIPGVNDHYRIVVIFVPESFTVQTSAGEGGSITPTPPGQTVPYGEGITIVATPDAYYGVSQIWINGAPLMEGDPVLTAVSVPIDPVIRDYEVVATFARTHHVINATAGSGGSISPSGDDVVVSRWATQSFIVEADPGFVIDEIKIAGVPQEIQENLTVMGLEIGSIANDFTIEATFAPRPYRITPSAGANGTINPPGTVDVQDGGSVVFTMTPADCYKIADVLVDGESVMNGAPGQDTFQIVSGTGTYTFNNVDSDHTIEVVFERIVCTISVESNGKGHVWFTQTGEAIGPNAGGFEVHVYCGGNWPFEVSPADCYVVDDIRVAPAFGDPVSIMDVVSVDPVSGGEFQLTNIRSDRVLWVIFRKLGPYTVTTSVQHPDGTGGLIGEQYSISPESGEVECGENVKLRVSFISQRIGADDSCYDFKLVITPESGEPITVRRNEMGVDPMPWYPVYEYELTNIRTNYTVELIYEKAKSLFIESTPGEGVIFEPKSAEVPCGEEGLFEIASGENPLATVRVETNTDSPVELMLDPPPLGLGAAPEPEGGFTLGFMPLEDLEGMEPFFLPINLTIDLEGNHLLDGVTFPVPVEAPPEIRQWINVMGEIVEEVPFSTQGRVIFSPGEIWQNTGQGGEEPEWVGLFPDMQIDFTEDRVIIIYPWFFTGMELNFKPGICKVTTSVAPPAPGLYHIAPPGTTELECGQDLTLSLFEHSDANLCYDFELKITGDNGEEKTVSRDELEIPQYNPLTDEYQYTYDLLNIQTNYTVELLHWQPTFTVKATSGPNGKLEPSGEWEEVDCGENMIFRITPDHCYAIHDVVVSIDGGDPVSVLTTEVDVDPTTQEGTYELINIRNNYTIEVTFVELGSFIVTAIAGEGGTVSPETAEVPCGEDLKVRIKPNYCYTIDEVTAGPRAEDQVPVRTEDMAVIDPITGEVEYTITDITSNYTVHATFKKMGPFTVTASVKPDSHEVAHGSIWPAGEIEVECGESRLFTIKSNDLCYVIGDVKMACGGGDPVSVLGELVVRPGITDTAEYMPPGIMSNCTVEVSFIELGPFTLLVDIEGTGNIWLESLDLGGSGKDFTDGMVDNIKCGSNWALFMEPDKGYELHDVRVQSGSDQVVSVMSDVIMDPIIVEEYPELGSVLDPTEVPLEGGGKHGFTVINNYRVWVVFKRKLGDANSDGIVDSRDALMALKITVGVIEPTEEQRKGADINEDGQIDESDARAIAQKSVDLAAEQHETDGSQAPGIPVVEVDRGAQILIMLADVYSIAGESVTMRLKVDSTDLLAAGDISVVYDSSVLRAVDVSSDADVLLAGKVDEPGIVRISFAGLNTLSSKTLANINFQVLTDDISPLTLERADLYGADVLPLDARKIDGRFVSWGIPPEHTALLQNFPNPFNPDTWIPYQLKEGSEVTIQIFNVQGELVREFDLGHKPAGSYVSQDRAVHWDGRNESGETVASGVYFYSLRTSNFATVRKLIILR